MGVGGGGGRHVELAGLGHGRAHGKAHLSLVCAVMT
jgi:hypothetical protein